MSPDDLHLPPDADAATLERARQEARQQGRRLVIDAPAAGGPTVGPDGTITLTPAEAGSKQEWDKALKQVDNDPSRIRVKQPAV